MLRPSELLVGSLREIEASVRRMRLWIDELVDVARLQVGAELRLNRAPTDLVGAGARGRERSIRRRASSHRLRVEAIEPRLVGEWDAERLQRVLANLVSNAIKYSPDGGDDDPVGREGATAVVAVRDFGVGIPLADLPHLFEQFHRASNVVGRIAGTGIGLGAPHGTSSSNTVERSV